MSQELLKLIAVTDFMTVKKGDICLLMELVKRIMKEGVSQLLITKGLNCLNR